MSVRNLVVAFLAAVVAVAVGQNAQAAIVFGPNSLGGYNAYELVDPGTDFNSAVTAAQIGFPGAYSVPADAGVIGHLASYASSPEFELLASLRAGASNNTYIGLTDDPALAPIAVEFGDTTGGVLPANGSVALPGQRGSGWAFVDTNTLSTFHQRTAGVSVWTGGEPNNSGGNENAAEIYSAGTLNDIGQSNTRPYIVEWDLNLASDPTPPPGPPSPPGWKVTDYFAKNGVPIEHDDHNRFRDLIADVPVDLGNGFESPIDHTAGPILAEVINFADPQNGGGNTWGGQMPFPGDTPNNDDRFGTRAEGFAVIPTAGDWSFAVGTDDTFELVINGNVIGTKGCCGDPNGPVLTANLPAGVLPISVEFGEDGGGAYFWLAAAEGNNVPFSTNTYRLVGDVGAGGLEVLAAAPAAAPEPSSLLLAALGLAGLALYRRRRKR